MGQSIERSPANTTAVVWPEWRERERVADAVVGPPALALSPPGSHSAGAVSTWLPSIPTPPIGYESTQLDKVASNSSTRTSRSAPEFPFPPAPAARPAPEPTPQASSDSSISTVLTAASFLSEGSDFSSQASDREGGPVFPSRKDSHPYARLVVITQSRREQEEDASSGWNRPAEWVPGPVGLGFSPRLSHSEPQSRNGSSDRTPTLAQPSAREGPSSPLRHNSLPQLVTTAQADSNSPRPPFLSPAETSEPDRLSPTSSTFNVSPSSPDSNRSQTNTPSPPSSALNSPSPYAFATSNRSTIPSATSQRLSPSNTRPSSSGTLDSNSTANSSASQLIANRPWVPDTDAAPSDSLAENSEPEVFKVATDAPVEFLDPRPEPRGVKLTIKKDDPDQVVIKVVLPGFTVDNITVALRRGHKVHIVADSYGEAGGHFEKLISLGTEVSSSQPKAEFDGSTLTVYVARRRAHTGRRTTPTSPSPEPTSSPETSASPVMSADRRPSLASMLEGEFPGQARPRSLTGPEGARAAAKAAREEANRRAKEQAKLLPKIGRRFHFRRDKSKDEPVLTASPPTPAALSPSSGSPAFFSPDTVTATTTAPPPMTKADSLSRNETLTPRRPTASPVPSSAASDAGSTSSGSVASRSERPKMRGDNLTLRPTSGGSFIEAALKSAHGHGSGSSSGHLSGDELDAPSEGSSTPRVERASMTFSPLSG